MPLMHLLRRGISLSAQRYYLLLRSLRDICCRLKYVDLFDTVFMILRGNWRQVSFLHVYHHSSVIYISWVNASVGYDGEIYYVVALK